jgi:hypothetical protein
MTKLGSTFTQMKRDKAAANKANKAAKAGQKNAMFPHNYIEF